MSVAQCGTVVDYTWLQSWYLSVTSARSHLYFTIGSPSLGLLPSLPHQRYRNSLLAGTEEGTFTDLDVGMHSKAFVGYGKQAEVIATCKLEAAVVYTWNHPLLYIDSWAVYIGFGLLWNRAFPVVYQSCTWLRACLSSPVMWPAVSVSLKICFVVSFSLSVLAYYFAQFMLFQPAYGTFYRAS